MNELEKRFYQTYEVFMAMPETPSLEFIDGRPITGCSTTYDAADQVVGELSDIEKLHIIKLLFDCKDFYIVADTRNLCEPGTQIINTIITEALAEELQFIPEIKEREISNLHTHSELYGFHFGQREF